MPGWQNGMTNADVLLTQHGFKEITVMANVAIQKVENMGGKPLPIFEAIEKRLDDVRQRAFGLFEQRGYELGHQLDDWLKAEHEVFGWPAAELTEKDGKYEAEITLPGFDPKEVQVTATPSEIIVHAETKHEKKIEKPNVLWTEFGSNDVYRRFELPARIDVDKTSATLDNGLLHITAAKAPVAQTKPVELRAA
jgi:HSP20 family protein